MKYSFLLIIVLLLFTPKVQAQESNRSSEKVKQAIQENFQKMGAAMATGNAKELSMYFTENAFLKFPEAQPLVGRKAVEEAHQHLIDQGISIRPNTEEVKVSGNTAYEIGSYRMLDKGGRQIDQGHYATVWEKKKEGWRISRDVISNTKEASPATEVVKKEGATDHLYVELWNPKQAWLNLDREERQAFFGKVGGEIQKLTGAGIEVLGFAVNDEETPYRSDHKYIAVWKMPSKEHVKMLEKSVEEAGWHTYFEQANARGELIPPPAALEDMIRLK